MTLIVNPKSDTMDMIPLHHSIEYSSSSSLYNDCLSQYSDSISISSEELYRFLDEDTDSAFSSGEDSEQSEYLSFDKLNCYTPIIFQSPIHQQRNTIVEGILSFLSSTHLEGPLIDDWKKFCPDDLCVYKTVDSPYEKMANGNFFEVNGTTREVEVENEYSFWERSKHAIFEGIMKEDDLLKTGDGLCEKLSNVGLIGDRETKKAMKRVCDEDELTAKEEALARITWDPSKRCPSHKEPLYVYCEVCCKLVCSRCIVDSHQNHRLIPKHTKESVFSTCKKLQAELDVFIKNVEKFVRNIVEIIEKIDQNAINAARDLLGLLDSWEYVGSCIHRRKYLINLLEVTRNVKREELLTQHTNLCHLLHRMRTNNSKLKNSYQTNNAYLISLTNEAVEEDLTLAAQYDYGCIPIHNEQFRIEVNQKFHRSTKKNQSAALTVSAPTVVDGIKDLALKKIPFVDRVSPDYKSKAGMCVFGRNGVGVDKNTTPCMSIGGEGSEEGKLCRPWGIACDKNGNLYISDRSNNRIQVFNPDGSLKFSFGKMGKQEGEFNRPAGIIIDPFDRIVVADKDNHRIQVFNLKGEYLFHFGTLGNQPGEFHYPWDVAVNSCGQIAVSDTKNRRVQVFTKDGAVNGVIEFYPYDLKLFDLPRAVKFTKDGELVVGDFNNHRFMIFDQVYSSFRIFGSEKEFNRPQGLCIDDLGNFIVSDSKNNRVAVYNRDTKFLREVRLCHKTPQDVCVLPNGNLAVVCLEDHAVYIV